MNSMCRTCMQINKKLIYILESKEKGRELSDILFECTSIRVQKNDVLPLHMCYDCLERLISSWDFRVMVNKTELKLHSIVDKSDKENILQCSNKCMDMTIIKTEEETTVVKSEKLNLSGQENIDINNSNYVLCSCVTEPNIDEKQEINKNIIFQSSNSSNVDQTTEITSSETNKSASKNSKSLEAAKENKYDNVTVFKEKLLKNNNESDKNILLANTDKQNEHYFSNDSDSSGDDCNIADMQDTEVEQHKNERDLHKKNKLSEDEDEEFGILLTDNSQSYLDKIIAILDKDDIDGKDLELLTKDKNKKFTRKERRKMFVFCKLCRKSFNYRTYTERHIFLHKRDRLVKCETCSKVFITKRELDAHKVVHSEDRSFTCKTCGKTFKRLNYLTKHETTHLETEPIKCNLCDKTYKREELLKIHLQTHKADTNCLCEQCGKVFSSAVSLNSHKYVHMVQRKLSCSICGKVFSRAHLRLHMRRHSEERPYVCSYCGKSFKSKKVMVNHSLIHTDEKPHSCRICGKLFKHSASLYNHRRVHTGETPYTCKMCPSSFKYSHHLKNHMKSHS